MATTQQPRNVPICEEWRQNLHYQSYSILCCIQLSLIYLFIYLQVLQALPKGLSISSNEREH